MAGTGTNVLINIHTLSHFRWSQLVNLEVLSKTIVQEFHLHLIQDFLHDQLLPLGQFHPIRLKTRVEHLTVHTFFTCNLMLMGTHYFPYTFSLCTHFYNSTLVRSDIRKGQTQTVETISPSYSFQTFLIITAFGQAHSVLRHSVDHHSIEQKMTKTTKNLEKI